MKFVVVLEIENVGEGREEFKYISTNTISKRQNGEIKRKKLKQKRQLYILTPYSLVVPVP